MTTIIIFFLLAISRFMSNCQTSGTYSHMKKIMLSGMAERVLSRHTAVNKTPHSDDGYHNRFRDTNRRNFPNEKKMPNWVNIGRKFQQEQEGKVPMLAHAKRLRRGKWIANPLSITRHYMNLHKSRISLNNYKQSKNCIEGNSKKFFIIF